MSGKLSCILCATRHWKVKAEKKLLPLYLFCLCRVRGFQSGVDKHLDTVLGRAGDLEQELSGVLFCGSRSLSSKVLPAESASLFLFFSSVPFSSSFNLSCRGCC